MSCPRKVPTLDGHYAVKGARVTLRKPSVAWGKEGRPEKLGFRKASQYCDRRTGKRISDRPSSLSYSRELTQAHDPLDLAIASPYGPQCVLIELVIPPLRFWTIRRSC